MTIDEFDNLMNEIQAQQEIVLISKRNDYANASIDVLDNFKNGANIVGITAEQQCLALMATKLARLGNLLSNNKTPNNESVIDSMRDLGNYTILLEAIYVDKRVRKTSKSDDDLIFTNKSST